MDKSGLPISEQFESIPFGSISRSLFSLLGKTGNILAQIPLAYALSISPVTFLSTHADFENIGTLASLSSVSFGKVGLEIGDVKYFMIYNPNDFQVQCSIKFESSTGNVCRSFDCV